MRYSIILLLLSCISCSDDHQSEREISIEIGALESFKIGELGLSGMVPFDFYPLNGEVNSFLIYNQFERRLDTLFFEKDTVRFSIGNQIPTEGPEGIPKFNFFVSREGENIFLTNDEVYVQRTEDLERIQLNDFEIFPNDKFTHIVRDNGFNKTFTGYDSGDKIYFLTKNFLKGKFSIYEYDLGTKTLAKVPFQLDQESLDIHKASFQSGRATIQSPNFPFLLNCNGKLIASYPFMSTIQVLDINSNSFAKFSPVPNNYPAYKKRPEIIPLGATTKQAEESINKWSDDVRYGPILNMGKKYFYRLVRAPNSGSTPIYYVEIFDDLFNKLLEENLSEKIENLDRVYFSTSDAIVLKVKDETDEDHFFFRRLRIFEK